MPPFCFIPVSYTHLAAGADCSKVLVIDDSDQPLTMADVRLEEAIVQTKAKMVVLDPVSYTHLRPLEIIMYQSREYPEDRTTN